jgi:molecular chaperone GrpE
MGDHEKKMMEKGKEESKIQVNDRRFWVQDESAEDKASVPTKQYPSVVEELKARAELAEQKLRERIETLDQENEAFRVRLAKDMDRRMDQEKLELFGNFLELIDNFERALKAAQETLSFEVLREGVQLNLELFLSKLKSLGIEPMDLLHQPFDPHEAEAVGVVAVDDSDLDQQIVEVVQRGFRWGEQVLRPARVRIGQYQAEQKSQSDENEATPLSSE